jgi:shikimate dehydrogenase
MRKFGLIGFPLGHSFSRQYFYQKFRDEKITGCSYENYPLEKIDQLPLLLKEEPLLKGLNVTIPYKSLVIPYLDSLSPEAAEIGAVNVISIRRNRNDIVIKGFNSDVTGFTGSLRPWLKSQEGNALVLGTGGSSKAVTYALRQLGMNTTLVSREQKPGTLTYNQVDEQLLMNTDLIVNTTPLGMFPKTDAKPNLDYSLLSEKHILFDLVYNPELTEFLKAGKERGCTIISGLKMLQLQAEKAWEIWNSDESDH